MSNVLYIQLNQKQGQFTLCFKTYYQNYVFLALACPANSSWRDTSATSLLPKDKKWPSCFRNCWCGLLELVSNSQLLETLQLDS